MGPSHAQSWSQGKPQAKHCKHLTSGRKKQGSCSPTPESIPPAERPCRQVGAEVVQQCCLGTPLPPCTANEQSCAAASVNSKYCTPSLLQPWMGTYRREFTKKTARTVCAERFDAAAASKVPANSGREPGAALDAVHTARHVAAPASLLLLAQLPICCFAMVCFTQQCCSVSDAELAGAPASVAERLVPHMQQLHTRWECK